MLAETVTASARIEAGEKAKSAKSEIWLGFLDTFRTLCIAPNKEVREIFERTVGVP
jgi:hypothetical protein